MKHLFITLSVTILCSFTALFAQNKDIDLIVTINGDSIKCTIIEIDFNEIYYRSGGEESEIEFIIRSQVKSYQSDFYVQPVNKINTTTDQPVTEWLTVVGRKVYQQNRELTVADVRNLLKNNIKFPANVQRWNIKKQNRKCVTHLRNRNMPWRYHNYCCTTV